MFAQDEPPPERERDRERTEHGFREVSGFKEIPEVTSRLSEEEVMML